MENLQEQKAIIKAELAEINKIIKSYESIVEEGLTLIADNHLVKEQIKGQVRQLIERNLDCEPVLITLLDGGFFITSLVLAEVHAYNEIARSQRCALLKLPSDMSKRSLVYAEIVDKLDNAPYCLISFNGKLYSANQQDCSLTPLDEQPEINPLMALFCKASMPVGILKRASKDTHNLIASFTSMPRDTVFIYEHTSMRTKSYEGIELREVTISSPPNCSVVDKPVIVVDDVYDSGSTYATVYDYLLLNEAKSVELMVLINKDIVHTDRVHVPVYECLKTSTLVPILEGEKPTEPFLVGDGMDYLSKRFRELLGIYGVDPQTLPLAEELQAILQRQKILKNTLDNYIKMTKMHGTHSLPRKLLEGIIQYPNLRVTEHFQTSEVVAVLTCSSRVGK